MLDRADRAKAIAAVEALALTGNNLVLAHYWLSLWSDGKPPARNRMNPAHLKDLLPGLSIVDVGDAPITRLAGSAIDLVCRRELRGVNLLDFVRGEERQLRRARLEAVVAGSVASSKIRYEASPVSTAVVETVQLPFCGVSETGARQYITHTNWRPDAAFARDPNFKYEVGLPDEYRAVAFA